MIETGAIGAGEVIESVLRGGAASISLLMAGALIATRDGGWSARLGVMFGLGTSAYALLSSDVIFAALGAAAIPLRLLAMFNSVFFWWFATALFDDRFAWRWWRFAPAAVIAVLATSRLASANDALQLVTGVAWQALVLAMMAHAVLLALRDLRDDLVAPRRRFRIAFILVVGITGLVIGVVELIELRVAIPVFFNRVHAVALFALALGFALAALATREGLFSARQAPAPQARRDDAVSVAPADAHLLSRLKAAMADGVYREPELSVSALAARLATPEHRLRKVINQGLGYRNFSSFLNAHRIVDAKAMLADPAEARRQIVQVAFDLGYGSIAPFNRAFKDATGATPSEWRRRSLSELVAETE